MLFEKIGEDCVLDTTTHLLWQKHIDMHTNYKAAQKYCADLVLNNRTDWRLPSIRELRTLAEHYNRYVFEEKYLTPNDILWSDTICGYNPQWVWGIDFNLGTLLYLPTTTPAYVRAVQSTKP